MKMGLGKTRLLLELIANSEKKSLVVCTKSNIQVWANEIKKFFPDTKYLILHNDYTKPTKTIDFTKKMLKRYKIIITTYETVRTHFEYSQPRCFIVRQDNFHEPIATPISQENIVEGFRIHDIIKTRKTTNFSPIFSVKYNRIVADECQYFASINSKIYKAMACIRGKYHYAISGTPIVNSELDLFSAFKFLGLNIVSREFNKEYYETNQLRNHIISKDYSDTTIKLPKLNEITVETKLTETEKRMYNDLVLQLRDAYTSFTRGNDTFAAPLSLFVRLRQICLCPYIITKDTKPDKKRYDKTLPDIFKDETVLEEFLSCITPETLQNLFKAYPALEIKLKTPYWRFLLIKLRLLPQFEIFRYQKLNLELASPDNIGQWSRLNKILELIKQIKSRNQKVIVFSSFVSFLNVLGNQLDSLDIVYRQLDGSTKSDDRITFVKEFNEDSKITVFLSSYKAGGTGLTMVSATNVILAEPWWNSATEQQAIFRTHRIGQTKPVNVYSMIANPSFENYLLKIQKKKSEKVEEYLGTKKNTLKRSIAKQIIENVVYSELLN